MVGINYPSKSTILIDLLSGPKTVLELKENQFIARQTILQHLHKLELVDFIKVKRHQPQPTYLLNPPAIPNWIYLALLEHPSVDEKKILHLISKEYIAEIAQKLNGS